MQLKNSTNDKTFRRIKNSQEERRGGRDGANFAGNAENQNTNLLHIWHKQHTLTHTHTDQEPKAQRHHWDWQVRRSRR